MEIVFTKSKQNDKFTRWVDEVSNLLGWIRYNLAQTNSLNQLGDINRITMGLKPVAMEKATVKI